MVSKVEVVVMVEVVVSRDGAGLVAQVAPLIAIHLWNP